MVDGNWEVAYFADDKEVALVLVDPQTGRVRESWTGYQVAWKMARGYSGAFGHKLNAPYVFLPLCAIFLRRPARLAPPLADRQPRPARPARLRRLQLLLQPRRDRRLGAAPVPGAPLPAGAGALDRPARSRGGAPAGWPAAWLLIAALFLVGFRVGLNVADSGAIDVGYAGVVGADRIAHGEPLYGNFPDDVSQGDTYGPVNYFAYVPFEAIWPWSRHLGRPPRRSRRGGRLRPRHLRPADPARPAHPARARPAASWRRPSPSAGRPIPTPPTLLESNSNDSLVAALLVATLLALARPVARGAMLAARDLDQVRARSCWRRCWPPIERGAAGRRYERPGRPLSRPRGVPRSWSHSPAPPPAAWPALDPGPSHLLRPHDRLPGRPRLAVQHLGPGPRPRAPPHRHPGRRRPARLRLRLPAGKRPSRRSPHWAPPS